MEEDWVEIESGKSASAETQPAARENSKAWNFEAVYKCGDTHGYQQKPEPKVDPIPKHDCDDLYKSLKETATARLASGHPIFKADLGPIDLADVFVSSLPEMHRQEMRCSCCFRFMHRVGHLVIVDIKTGNLLPLFWNAANLKESNVFKIPVQAVSDLFIEKRASNSFKILPSRQQAGTAMSGGFEHMHFVFPADRVVKEAGSQLDEHYAAMLDRVLQDYDNATVNYVAKLILQDKLPYASTHKAAIKWLRDLRSEGKIDVAKDANQRHNLIRHCAFSSFVGCINQLRSGTLSTILDAVKEGQDFEQIKRSWEVLAGPRMYMRPQAAPSIGQIAAAEKLFEELGLTKQDMRRKFLTPAEIPEHAYLYRSADLETSSKPGVFGNIVPKESRSTNPQKAVKVLRITEVPPTAISFAKLVNDILPKAKYAEYKLPQVASIFFFTTGFPGTKPLMQFHDSENLASWYTHQSQTIFPSKSLRADWTHVEGIVAFPHMWTDLKSRASENRVPTSESEQETYFHKRHGFRYLIQLQGAKEDTRIGLGLFPTLLKGEFHGIRSTIEAYSLQEKIEEAVDTDGNSLPSVGGAYIDLAELLQDDRSREHVFRVWDAKGDADTYKVALFS